MVFYFKADDSKITLLVRTTIAFAIALQDVSL